ncbi:MAG: hypothetical protein HGB17_10010 [Syntrophobacteraceae bacterium]|nr:hypothetical protein [Syntrophobacteraceae bacterium]
MAQISWPIRLLCFVSLFSCLAQPVIAGELMRPGVTVETCGAAYFQSKDPAESQYGELRVRPRLELTPRDEVLFLIEGDFRADTRGYARDSLDSVVERTGRRWIANLREAYADGQHGWLRMRVGKQIFDWSVTDTVSPSDNISPRDWTDVLESERVGVPAVHLHLGYSTFADLVFVPWFTPSKLPVLGGRWERDLPPVLVSAEQEILGRDHSQFAARAGTTWEGFDLGIVYYRGYANSPSFKLEPVSLVKARLVPVYRLEEVYAFSVSRAVGSYTLRSEVGHFNQRGDDDFVQVVAGIDREWSGVLRPVDSFYALLQYADEAVTRHESPVPLETIDFRRVLNKSVMLKTHYTFDSERQWTLQLEAALNLDDGGSFIEPALVWRKRNIEWETGIDILSGNRTTFFGGYGRNDRVYTRITCKF